MQFSTLLAIFSTASTVLGSSVLLHARFTNSDSAELKGLSSVHEGAGFSFFELGDSAETLSYDDSTGEIYLTVNSQTDASNYTLGAYGNFLSLGVAGDGESSFEVQGNQLVESSGKKFFAGKNMSDPYSYSASNYLVGVAQDASTFSSASEITEIKVYVDHVAVA